MSNESINVKGTDKESELSSVETETGPKTPPKPIKPEEKPFDIFINEHLIPDLNEALQKFPFESVDISFKKGKMPLVNSEAWLLICKLNRTKSFWLCFQKENIASKKTICLVEDGAEPSLLESFLIDEKKTTLVLLISRILQRLNGQKWLGPN